MLVEAGPLEDRRQTQQMGRDEKSPPQLSTQPCAVGNEPKDTWTYPGMVILFWGSFIFPAPKLLARKDASTN